MAINRASRPSLRAVHQSEMFATTAAIERDAVTAPPAWPAIFAIALGVASLIIAEFLPAGMLTPMAAELRITEGAAGQAVTVTSIFAVVTSLLIAFITRRLDRRHVLLGLSLSLVISNVLVACAPSFALLLAGRMLLGIALGGFWSMAAATAARLVPEARFPRAIALIFGASSLASVFAAPASSFLSSVIGWRNVFWASAILSAAALIFQAVTIPSVKPRAVARFRTIVTVLRKPQFAAAMAGVMLVFCGYFVAFTYVRPFLERITSVGPNGLTTILFAFGIANFIGTSLAGVLVEKRLRQSLVWLPIALTFSAVGLVVFGHSMWMTTLFVFAWGAAFGPVSVVWSAWVSRKVPEHAETAGGLLIAAIQLSAAFGAIAGGILFDGIGPTAVFGLSAAASILSAMIVGLRVSKSVK